MHSVQKQLLRVSMTFALCCAVSAAWAQKPASDAATIVRMSLLKGSALELEIAANGPVAPKTQVLTAPNRLVMDFPNSVPAKGIRNLEINRDDVTGARVGLFSADPPITRIVLDLKSPQPYQVFSHGNTVVVKFGAKAAGPSDSEAPQTIVSIEHPEAESAIQPQPAPGVEQTAAIPAQAAPRMEVVFENGLLSIRSNHANLSEVLSEVHRRTGAEIAIPPGAESEQVFTNLGPGSPKEVLGSLLNGSHFNFIVIGSERDPGGVRQVVLTPKQPGASAEGVVYPCGSSQPAVAQAVPEPVVSPMSPPPMVPTPDGPASDPNDSQGQPPMDNNQPAPPQQ